MLLPVLRQGLLVSAALFAALPAASSPQESTSAPRLLTAKEGRSVVAAAWEHREQVRRRPDCSHLVHQVYRFAGFSYPYASSFDLYDGTDSFRRVSVPRPGDLVVWPGHVGIVVDPAEHTFYSSVQSGLRTEYYDGPYWRSQGKPRFLRYVRTAGDTLLAARDAARTGPSGPRTHAVASPTGKETVANTPDDSSAEEHDSAAPASTPPNRPVEIPSSILVVAPALNRPTPQEVSDAISELASASGSLLRSGPPLDARRPVSIYDDFTVERLEFKRDSARAHVRVATRLSIAGEKFDSKRRSEKLRLELRRTTQGWQLLASPNRAYVPRDVAVHVLAAQLALLTQDGPAAGDDGAPRNAAATRERTARPPEAPAERAADRATSGDRPRRQYLIVRALSFLVDAE